MKHGAAQHRVEAPVGEGDSLDRLLSEILFRQVWCECAGERPDLRYRGGGEVDAANVETLPQEVGEVASRPAAGVEYAHPRVKATFEELVEEVHVDAAELFL